MMHFGFLSSYTERVYMVGTGAGTPLRYVPLGDSLTAGIGVAHYTDAYPYLLAKRLSETTGTQILLKPHAIPGATTADAIAHLLDRAIASQPDLVTVLLGVNDVYQAVPPDTFRANYDTILRRLTQETHATIYLISIPMIGAPDHFTPSDHAMLDARTQALNKILSALADTYHLPLIDLYTPTLEPSREDGYFSADHFHPSAAGYAQWADIIYDHLDR